MKSMIMIGIVLATMVGGVQADPIDPEPNGIGIYFEEGAGADSWCATAAPGSQVTAYLCLTRAEDTSGFVSWECRIESSVPEALNGFVLRGDATNAAQAPEFVVSLANPLPFQLSTVLMDITVDVLWEWPIGFRVWPPTNPRGPVSFLAAYEAAGNPGTFYPLQPPFGLEPGTEVPSWCAAVNDDTCLGGPSVETEESSWGSLKALYRD